MPRRGRSASPPPAQRRPVPSSVPARVAPAPPPAPVAAAPVAAAPQQPSLFKQMAATAGGVAVGSAVGHTLGHAMTGMLGGGGSSNETAPAQAAPQPVANGVQPNEPTGPCAWEIKQFLQCAQGQSDLTLCEGFNEALRQCKQQNSMH
ncbi:coiled-coil-helix-coiled-coil-helix domain-containing protein 2 isoform X1 [Hermetia illucens]|uniref:coiled-coil-helix-coiled-coil-helix domain-containing protein 2 isoform X1 n=1 Tax=Hermetia illucens TaxID=343691 RepID=UPI0018CC224E|nr:coiled-coil-helix-coiled-coil-helix domain-containing protein 2 isoform X1 [Hermetia illucens]